ncbi:related to Spindle pole body component KRE28 [Zygosaccharomyces bailii ISA1307]|nr:related to Spindle pole body component KRE28 [Zygosaccharomyces bailii ISA1307]
MQLGFDDYGARIKDLEDETARFSEQSLNEQEHKVLASLREITQSVEVMNKDNRLVQLQGYPDASKQEQIVDPSGLNEKIDTFAKLVELLKLTHLEQETLDYFLRYTISSTNLLQLDSVQDSKYVQLKQEVNELEKGALDVHLREIDVTKSQIVDLCKDLNKTQENINETYLETTNVLDDCETLLGQLTQLRAEKQTSEEADTVEDNPAAQTYENWQLLQESQADLLRLEREETRLKGIVRSYEKLVSGPNQVKNDPKLLQTHSSLALLVKIWQAKFLPQYTINLELFPQTRKFQFDVAEVFTVVITLCEKLAIRDIQIHRTNTKSIPADQSTEDSLKDKHMGTRNIYNALDDIIHTLRGLEKNNRVS